MNWCSCSDFYDYYADTGSTGVAFYPKESKFDKYFDYDGLYFSIDDSTPINFGTDIQYLKYTLYDRLNEINPTIFTSTFTGITQKYTLTDISNCEYTDRNRIRISSNTSGLTNIFTPYTYVNIVSLTNLPVLDAGYSSSGNTGLTWLSGGTSFSGETDIYDGGGSLNGMIGLTLIYSVSDYELIIEAPKLWNSYIEPNIDEIRNIDGLKNISDILYEVYIIVAI